MGIYRSNESGSREAPADEAGGTRTPPLDQISYMQTLLDDAHAEIAQYKSGLADEIRRPLLMELIGMAHSVEQFLDSQDERLTVADYRNFLELGVLGDLRQSLGRYNVEPFICSTRAVNRRFQKVERVEETDDPALDGAVRSTSRGHAQMDRVLQK
ncbi:MAG: hypothetical protein ACR2GA_07800 [Chloroflexota bacterium]